MTIAPFFIAFMTVEVSGGLTPSAERLRSEGGVSFFLVKAAGATLDYPIGWTLDPGETIVASTWGVTPAETGGIEVVPDSSVIVGMITACLISGGVFRRVYELVNTITTSAGRVRQATLTIRIGADLV